MQFTVRGGVGGVVSRGHGRAGWRVGREGWRPLLCHAIAGSARAKVAVVGGVEGVGEGGWVKRAGGAPRGSDLGPHLLNEFLPQRGSAYQPRATPWESYDEYIRILTEGRGSSHHPAAPERSAAPERCGAPSERIHTRPPLSRMHVHHSIPRVAPWAGMR